MKILILHNKYQSIQMGGEDIVYQNEIEALTRELGKENVLYYDVSNDNLKKISLFFSIWYSFKHYFAIKKLVKKENVSIVHVHNFFPLLTPSVFVAAKKAGAKVILTLHNYRLWCISGVFYRDDIGICEQCVDSKFPLAGIKNKCYRKSTLQSIIAQLAFSFYRAMNFYKYIDKFFVLTEFQRQKVISLGVDTKKVILKPNFVKKISGVHGERNGYIFIGRLEKNKGIFEVLKTWEILSSDFNLIIVGNGEDLEGLKQKYSKFINIKFMGKCSRDETLKLIAKSKYLIQSSLLYETFGLTIIEALMLGVPVIGFNIGTRPEFINDEVNGYICNQIEDLKDTIKKSFACDSETYNKMSKSALLTYSNYDINKITALQLEVYNKI